jgi:hypothetical protein
MAAPEHLFTFKYTMLTKELSKILAKHFYRIEG